MGKENAQIPDKWPEKYSTAINSKNPILITDRNNNTFASFISSSPPPFSAVGRTGDIDALLNVILTAEKFVHISVMDYEPLILFSKKIQ